MIAILLRAGKAKILIASAILVVLTTLVDWMVGNNVSLAASYVLPIMLAAIVLRPAGTAIAALFCSYLRSLFDRPVPQSKLPCALPSPLRRISCSVALLPSWYEIANWSSNIWPAPKKNRCFAVRRRNN